MWRFTACKDSVFLHTFVFVSPKSDRRWVAVAKNANFALQPFAKSEAMAGGSDAFPIERSLFGNSCRVIYRMQSDYLPNAAKLLAEWRAFLLKSALSDRLFGARQAVCVGLSYTLGGILHLILHKKPPMLAHIYPYACRMCRRFSEKNCGGAWFCNVRNCMCLVSEPLRGGIVEERRVHIGFIYENITPKCVNFSFFIATFAIPFMIFCRFFPLACADSEVLVEPAFASL